MPLEKPAEIQKINAMKACIINGSDYFSNLTDLLEAKGFNNIKDVNVTSEGGELGKKMKVTFKLNGRNQGFFLDYGTMLTNFVPAGENVRNIPSHEHVGIMNAILDFVRKNDLKLSAIESTTQDNLQNLMEDTTQSA